MIEQEKAPAAKSEDSGSVPGTHVVEAKLLTPEGCLPTSMFKLQTNTDRTQNTDTDRTKSTDRQTEHNTDTDRQNTEYRHRQNTEHRHRQNTEYNQSKPCGMTPKD